MRFNALNHMQARRLPPGKYADGQGLWLVKRTETAGKWVLRLSIDQRRREMGLGRWPDVSLASVREAASEARREVRHGRDPIRTRAESQRRTKRLTVGDAVTGCFKARQAELKADGTAGRWLSPLSTHIVPKIGTVAVEDVDQHTIKRVLAPIWHKKPEAARKAANRLGLVLKHAAALGLDVDLQATSKARALLGKQRHTVTHIPSLPYTDAPAFYRFLTTNEQISCLALRFLMLTVLRTSEVRFARITDVDDDVLVVPAAHTKTGVEHRVPLTSEARLVIDQAQSLYPSELLFPSPRGKPLSDAAMSRFMERAGYAARPHGFRATFRTWVEEQTDTPFEVKEACLGHVVDGAVTRAYQRSDRLAMRRNVLQQWASYLINFEKSNANQ